MSSAQKGGISTRAIHAQPKEEYRDLSKALVHPITHTAVYRFPKPGEIPEGSEFYVYGRYGNPSLRALEATLAAVEGAKHAFCFGTGMAAATAATIALLQQGDHFVVGKKIYGGLYNLSQNELPKAGVDVTMVDGSDLAAVRAALRPNTKVVWFEPCTNPTCFLVDIESIAKSVHEYNKDIIVAVDNTFLTPYVMRPLEKGVDLVFHSMSKYLNGHADVIAGTLMMNDDDLAEKIKYTQKTRGLTPSAFDCSLVSRALQTFEIRMMRHHSNGLEVAKFLERHPSVEKIHHPLLETHPQYELGKRMLNGRYCGMIAVYVKKGLKANKFVDLLGDAVLQAPSLGGVHSVVNIPAQLSHVYLSEEERDSLGITGNMVRLSVGIENPEDIIADLKQALDQL